MKLNSVVVALAIALLSTGAQSQVYKWTDENGKVHYSERPMSQSSQSVKNRQSSGTIVCDTTCQARIRQDKFDARLEEELRNVPRGVCSQPYNALNKRSKELAYAAVRECKRNYAMQKIDPDYKPSTKARDASNRQNKAVQQAVRDAQTAQRHQEMMNRLDDIADEQREANRQAAQPQELRLRNSYNGAEARCTRNALGSYDCR